MSRRRRRVMTPRVVPETVVRGAGRLMHRRRESLTAHHRRVVVIPAAAGRLRLSPLGEAKRGESQNTKYDVPHCFTPSFPDIVDRLRGRLFYAPSDGSETFRSLRPSALFNTKRKE